jgi:hypothetical protein
LPWSDPGGAPRHWWLANRTAACRLKPCASAHSAFPSFSSWPATVRKLSTFDRIAPIARDAVSGANDVPELLGVEMQKIAGRGVLVALRRLGRLQIREPGQARARQHPCDGGLRDPDTARDAALHHTTPAQFDDQQRLGRIDRPRAAPGAR